MESARWFGPKLRGDRNSSDENLSRRLSPQSIYSLPSSIGIISVLECATLKPLPLKDDANRVAQLFTSQVDVENLRRIRNAGAVPYPLM